MCEPCSVAIFFPACRIQEQAFLAFFFGSRMVSLSPAGGDHGQLSLVVGLLQLLCPNTLDLDIQPAGLHHQLSLSFSGLKTVLKEIILPSGSRVISLDPQDNQDWGAAAPHKWPGTLGDTAMERRAGKSAWMQDGDGWKVR